MYGIIYDTYSDKLFDAWFICGRVYTVSVFYSLVICANSSASATYSARTRSGSTSPRALQASITFSSKLSTIASSSSSVIPEAAEDEDEDDDEDDDDFRFFR